MNDGDTEAGQGGQKGWSGWAPYSCVCASPAPAAATWELDNFASGQCAGVGLTMNDGDTEDGQGGQKGWSGWAPYSCVCASPS